MYTLNSRIHELQTVVHILKTFIHTLYTTKQRQTIKIRAAKLTSNANRMRRKGATRAISYFHFLASSFSSWPVDIQLTSAYHAF